MKKNNIKNKSNLTKISSMLKVSSKEWNLILFIISILAIILGCIFLSMDINSNLKKSKFFVIGISVIITGLIILFIGLSNFFGLLNLYYFRRRNKFSRSENILNMYNSLGKKYNLVFKNLDFKRIYILPSCADGENISTIKNRGLNNSYTFIKNNKEYNLVFRNIKYISQLDIHPFYKKILLDIELFSIKDNNKTKINLRDNFKDSNIIKMDKRFIDSLELLNIKGVSVKKTSYKNAFESAGDFLINTGNKYHRISKRAKFSWEGYTYWNKNMKEWRKDYLQESYRLPGVWCNNDVKAKDMDEYIEKKINFECQLINDIFDNFEINDLSINNN